MSIENDEAVRSYTVTASTLFPLTLTGPQYWLPADITVYDIDQLTQVKEELTLDADYTLSGANAEDGATVVLSSRFYTGTSTIVIVCDPAREQPADYVRNDDFPADTHETALDKLTRMAQVIRRKLDRAFTWDVADSASYEFTPPTVAERKNKIVGFDGAGEPQLQDAVLLTSYTYQGEWDLDLALDLPAPVDYSAGDGFYIKVTGSATYYSIEWFPGDIAIIDSTGANWLRLPYDTTVFPLGVDDPTILGIDRPVRTLGQGTDGSLWHKFGAIDTNWSLLLTGEDLVLDGGDFL